MPRIKYETNKWYKTVRKINGKKRLVLIRRTFDGKYQILLSSNNKQWGLGDEAFGPKKQKTIFFKPKHDKYAKMVSLENPLYARLSTNQLKDEFYNARTTSKTRRIARVTQLARNRAYAMSKKKDLSEKERKELKEVGQIYGKTSRQMWKNINAGKLHDKRVRKEKNNKNIK